VRYRIASDHALGRPDLAPINLPYPKSEHLWDELKELLVSHLKNGVNPMTRVSKKIAIKKEIKRKDSHSKINILIDLKDYPDETYKLTLEITIR